ncbi:hypothetical protein ACFWYA_00315 [Streptomyces sp. NPDC059011]|uniref:hypothetical protein n=1 Tax=unclassified Streptomyces TaxID=2593676 RepID=UPI0036C14E27
MNVLPGLNCQTLRLECGEMGPVSRPPAPENGSLPGLLGGGFDPTGQSDLPSSLNPRWKSSWAAIRAFSSKHRALTAVLGAIALGLISGACRVLGENFTEQILTWIIQR